MKTNGSMCHARDRSCFAIQIFRGSLLVAAALIASCGSDSPVSGGDGGTPPPGDNTVRVELTSWDDNASFPTLKTPAAVQEVTITVSADDISTVTRTVTSPDSVVEETIEVGLGASRRFAVEARDTGGQIIYRGLRYANLESTGQGVAVAMVTTADTQPPDFTGVSQVEPLSDTVLSLAWPTATEGGAPAIGASYLIYAANTSGGQDFATPTAATSPGEASALLTGLAPATPYYVVVRAVDAAGNVDANNVELSAVTFSSGDGIYVDVNAGTDSPTCGTPGSPCKTITTGLSRSSGNQPIFIAKGSYTETSGETFPLQLKAGTSLNGTLSGGRTVISSTTLPTIVGAAGATLFKCVVQPHASSVNGNVTVDSNGESMRILFSEIDISQSAQASGVKLWDGEVYFSSFLGNQHQSTLRVYGNGTEITWSHFSGAGVGIAVYGPARNVRIMHNVVENGLIGIASGGIPEARDCLIFHNTITGNTGDGLNLTAASGFVVESNTIQFNGQTGIDAAGGPDGGTVECVLNTIAHNGYYGIHAGAGLGDGVDSLVAYSNAIACNTLNDLHVAPLTYADVRYNYWEHDPPTVGTDPSLTPTCPGDIDICYHGAPPVPIYMPSQPPAGCGPGPALLPLRPGLVDTGGFLSRHLSMEPLPAAPASPRRR